MPSIPSIPGTGSEPSRLKNPKCALRIYGASDILIQDLDVVFDISKDLDEEPNEATITIHNLSENTRNQIIDPAIKDTPIEVLLTPFGSEDLIVAFVGEVDKVTNTPLHPGFETRLDCSSQKWQHRSKYVEQKTYPMGTPITTVVNDFVDVINLPAQVEQLPPTGLLLAQSFSGPAFPLLQRFVYDFGRFCYILDGTMHISSVFTPLNPITVPISDSILVTMPNEIERSDAIEVELKTVNEMTNVDPLRRLTRKEKKVIKKLTRLRKKLETATPGSQREADLTAALQEAMPEREDLVQVDAVDTVIHGIECDTLCLPTLQPDNIVEFENGKQYRVQTVDHFGETPYDATTHFTADDYDGGAPLWSAF